MIIKGKMLPDSMNRVSKTNTQNLIAAVQSALCEIKNR